MTSILFTADRLTTTTLPTITAAWVMGGWLKINSGGYGGGTDLAPFGFGVAGGDSEGFLFDVLSASNTTLSALLFANAAGDIDTEPVLTGSDTVWVAWVLQYSGSGTIYNLRVRHPDVTTWTSFNLDCGVQLTQPGEMRLGSNQFDEDFPTCNWKGFFCQAGVTMDDATALAATQNAGSGAAPSGTNLHWLPLLSTSEQSGATWTNGGTAAAWSVTGAPANDSSDPNETLSGPGNPSLSPVDNATNVIRDPGLTLTFAEPVAAVSGNITIKKTSDNSTIETISVTDGSKVSISSNVVTVNPSTTLAYSTEYYVLVDAGAFESTVDAEDWAGIASTTAWSFTTRAGIIVLEATGTIAYSTAGGTSVAPGWPTTATSGARDVLIVGMKPGTSGGGSVTTPSGWALVGSITAAGAYGAQGVDTGDCDLYVYDRDTNGTASGTLSVTITTGTNGVAWGQIHRLSKESGTWSSAIATGSDTSAGSVSIAFGSDPGVVAQDYILAAMCIPTDVTTPSQFSAQAFTQTGVTFGTVAEISEADSTAGNDIGGFTVHARATAGTSSAAPTMTATAGGTTTNVRGPGVFVRLRAADVSAGPVLARARSRHESTVTETFLRRAFSAASFAVSDAVVDQPPPRMLRILRDERVSGDLPAARRWILPSSVDTPQLLLWSGFPDDRLPPERVQRARVGPLVDAPPVGDGSAAASAFAVAAAGLVTFTGSGGSAMSSFAAGAAGTETFNGSSSAALSPFAASASGTEGFVGSGMAAEPPFAASSSGAETFTGTGTAAASPFAVSGAGAQGAFFSGTGAAAASPFAVSAVGTAAAFTGAGSAQSAPFAVDGTGFETFAGTATTVSLPFAVDALGISGNVTTGSAAAALAPFATTGAGAESFAGTSSCESLPFGVDGAGTETFLCSCSAALASFALLATGATGAGGFFGVATCALPPFASDGSGVESFAGSASTACSPFGASGAQSYPFVTAPPASRLAHVRQGKPRITRA